MRHDESPGRLEEPVSHDSRQACCDRSAMVPMDRVPVAGRGGIPDQIGAGGAETARPRVAVVLSRRFGPSR